MISLYIVLKWHTVGRSTSNNAWYFPGEVFLTQVVDIFVGAPRESQKGAAFFEGNGNKLPVGSDTSGGNAILLDRVHDRNASLT